VALYREHRARGTVRNDLLQLRQARARGRTVDRRGEDGLDADMHAAAGRGLERAYWDRKVAEESDARRLDPPTQANP